MPYAIMDIGYGKREEGEKREVGEGTEENTQQRKAWVLELGLDTTILKLYNTNTGKFGMNANL